jgi:hypothetical protein
MPNGAHAIAVALPLDPPVEAPIKTIAPGEIEQRIGKAAADAAIAISIGMAEFAETGSFSPGVKAEGGRTLAAVVMLALEHFGEFDFQSVLRREGRRVLEARYGILAREHLGAIKTAAAFDDLVGHVSILTGHVVAEERARAH